MGGQYGFGRVIRNDLKILLPLCLTYFYRPISNKVDLVPQLEKNNLIIPPQLLATDSWRHGVFQTLDTKGLTSVEDLPIHCFQDLQSSGYRDETGRELKERHEPSGKYGVTGLQSIEIKIGLERGIIKSVEEYLALPNLTALPRKRRASDPIMVELTVAHEALDAPGIDLKEIEFGFGDSGTTEDSRSFSFDVSPKKLPQFVELLQIHLRSLGISDYRLIETESGKPIE